MRIVLGFSSLALLAGCALAPLASVAVVGGSAAVERDRQEKALEQARAEQARRDAEARAREAQAAEARRREVEEVRQRVAAQESQRAAEQRVRQEEQTASTAQAEEVLQRAQEDWGATRLAWSGVICRWAIIRDEAKKGIEKEKRYAREGGGIIDMREMYAEQKRMRRADDRIERAKNALADGHATPMSCKEKPAKSLAACLTAAWQGTEGSELCFTGEGAILMELAFRADSWLRR